MGDSARLIDDFTRVVSPGNVGALARAMMNVLDLAEPDRLSLGQRDSKRIRGHYGLENMTEAYLAVYEEVPTQS